MRNSIVEGEPGIFPAPIAQVYGVINRWVRRRTRKATVSREDHPPPEEQPPEEQPPEEQPPPEEQA